MKPKLQIQQIYIHIFSAVNDKDSDQSVDIQRLIRADKKKKNSHDMTKMDSLHFKIKSLKYIQPKGEIRFSSDKKNVTIRLKF